MFFRYFWLLNHEYHRFSVEGGDVFFSGILEAQDQAALSCAARRCSGSAAYRGFYSENKGMRGESRLDKVHYVETADAFWTGDNEILLYDNHALMYYDESHINRAGAQRGFERSIKVHLKEALGKTGRSIPTITTELP